MERVRPQPALKPPQRRKSVFMEVGLVDEQAMLRERSPAPTLIQDPSPRRLRPSRTVRFRSKNDIFDEREEDDISDAWESVDEEEEEYNSISTTTVQPTPASFTPSRMHRLGLLTIMLALMLPVLQTSSFSPMGVRGGVIPQESIESIESNTFAKRQDDTSVEVCKRWSGQSKLYYFLTSRLQADMYSYHCQRDTLHVWLPYYHRCEANERYLE